MWDCFHFQQLVCVCVCARAGACACVCVRVCACAFSLQGESTPDWKRSLRVPLNPDRVQKRHPGTLYTHPQIHTQTHTPYLDSLSNSPFSSVFVDLKCAMLKSGQHKGLKGLWADEETSMKTDEEEKARSFSEGSAQLNNFLLAASLALLTQLWTLSSPSPPVSPVPPHPPSA